MKPAAGVHNLNMRQQTQGRTAGGGAATPMFNVYAWLCFQGSITPGGTRGLVKGARDQTQTAVAKVNACPPTLNPPDFTQFMFIHCTDDKTEAKLGQSQQEGENFLQETVLDLACASRGQTSTSRLRFLALWDQNLARSSCASAVDREVTVRQCLGRRSGKQELPAAPQTSRPACMAPTVSCSSPRP